MPRPSHLIVVLVFVTIVRAWDTLAARYLALSTAANYDESLMTTTLFFTALVLIGSKVRPSLAFAGKPSQAIGSFLSKVRHDNFQGALGKSQYDAHAFPSRLLHRACCPHGMEQ